jgi:hypothetical protein
MIQSNMHDDWRMQLLVTARLVSFSHKLLAGRVMLPHFGHGIFGIRLGGIFSEDIIASYLGLPKRILY